MKKFYFLVLLIAASASAQIVNIPDANFKAKLLQASTANMIASTETAYVTIDTNSDGEIQVSEALNIVGLFVSHNTGDGENYINDLTGLTAFANLKYFNCSDQALTSIDISGFQALQSLTCSGNQLTTLDISENNALIFLDCKNNQLTSIIKEGLYGLVLFDCSNNLLQSLDLSDVVYGSNDGDYYLDNNMLTYLNLKNGHDSYVSFSGNPDLVFICVDESETPFVQAMANTYGYDGCVINTYCSFIPGGNYNTISGTQLFDNEGNGCDSNELAFPNLKIKINDGTNSGATFTNTSGNYTFYTQAGNFTLTPEVENPTYFNFNPTNAVVNFPIVDNSIATQNFCITPNGNHKDLEIVIAPIVPARPGFDAVYQLVYKNKGNQTVDGFVNFTFNDAVLDFVSSSDVPTNAEAGFMFWVVPNIAPFQSGSITVTLNVNSPQEIPAVNIDDVLDFNAFIDVSTDDIWADNNFDFDQIVVGSFDPNDIQCIEGDVVSPDQIGNYLHYLIRFENTGTATAENIVVKTVINPADFDINSLQLLSSSHNFDARVNGNIVEFIFEGIFLDTGGHGNILLKIKSDATLTTEDIVTKQADIFFDYNFPVATNEASTAFQILSVGDVDLGNAITIYPNPATDMINVKANNVTLKSLQLYDVQGRLLINRLMENEASSVDISSYSSGIYYLKVITDKGSTTQKIVKK